MSPAFYLLPSDRVATIAGCMDGNALREAEQLIAAWDRTRRLTLELVRLASDEELRTAFHPDFSPIGWHLGHIATFEAFWVLERTHGESPLSSEYDALFDPRQVAKHLRTTLPSRQELLAYATDVRRRTLDHLRRDAEHPSDAELRRGFFVYRFILMHEQQHAETIATILRMRSHERRQDAIGFGEPETVEPINSTSAIELAGGVVTIGEDDRLISYDNERPAHEVELKPYEIDAYPVTNAEWLWFVQDGGYRRREWWTPEGWAWLQQSRVRHPWTWEPSDRGFHLKAFTGDAPLLLDHPVEGISAFEAEAYARSVEKRLPTEVEWEHAARQHATAEPQIGVRCGGTRERREGPGTFDFVGNVWEWTASTFDGYPGFRAFPYDGYSRAYFDGQHRVLRGGSWATQELIARPGFRNWYPPHWRQMFVGLRCARDL
jgi:ergothioneine biosynthesis protein EgtB